MKTTKIVMIVTLMAFVAMSYAGVDPGPNSLSIKISLKAAKQDRGLVQAIYHQVDPSVLLQGDQPMYSAKVKYRGNVYVIFAKFNEWKRFFHMELDANAKEKGPRNHTDQPLFKSAK